jgi:hypothetical protein
MHLRDKTTRRLVVLGAIGALAVGALAWPALAQDASGQTSEPSEQLPKLEERFTEHKSAFAEALAEELDLPVDQVTEAIEAANERLADQWREERTARLQERLDQAVEDGDLTQEQADAIMDAVASGVLPGLPGPPIIHRFEGPDRGLRFHEDGPPRGWFGAPDVPTPDDPASEGSAA